MRDGSRVHVIIFFPPCASVRVSRAEAAAERTNCCVRALNTFQLSKKHCVKDGFSYPLASTSMKTRAGRFE